MLAALGIGGAAATAAAAAGHTHRPHHLPAAQPWPAGAGVRVEEVVAGTAAARAGLRVGDVILAANGRAISGYGDLDPMVAASGRHGLTLEVDRGGRRLRLKVSPRPLVVVHDAFGTVEHRRVLGIAHTEERWMLIPCARDPDCE